MASSLNCNQLTQAELNVIPDKELETRGEIEHHLSSFNEFASTGLMQIMTEIFTISRSFINERNKTPEDRDIETINFEVKITNVKVNKPTYNLYNSGKTMPLMPNLARRDLKTYSAGIYVDAKIEAKAYKKNQAEPVIRRDNVKNFRIASLPTMVRSELCNTHKLPKQALKMFEEDPTDLGGYFIIKGTEWAIDSIESRVYNYFHCFKNVGFRNELARGEYISKPGDAYENSAEFKIIYQDNGAIVIDITNPYFENMSFPFHVIFRLLGFNNDKEIFDNIVMSYGSAVSDHMIDVLKGAVKKGHSSLPKVEEIRDQASILAYLAERLNVGAVPKDNKGNPKVLKVEEKQYFNNLILNVFDIHFLTHMGTRPEDRRKKLRLLGQLIHRLLLVEMGILESTNRDSLATKRMAPAGRSYAKVFKTQFNLAIVQAIRKRLSRDFKYTSFSQVNLAQSFMSAINGPDLERALVQAIVNGDKIMMIKNKPITNRLSSQLLNRKNPLNVVSALRNIRTPNTSSSKQDARADEMRRVQPTYPGFIDISQSADTGEMVGLAKQMPISTSIANTGVSAELKLKLLEDEDIKKLDDVTNEELASGWSKIFVNGEWIGATRYSHKLVEKYRNYRRNYADNLIISPYTTIHFDTNTDDINFWVDAGRLMRPLIIVKNNYDEIKDGDLKNFYQDILVTKRHIQALIADKLTVEDLLSQGVVEYLAPEEQQNMLIAQDLNELRKNANNPLVRYTHCECPIALFGLPSLLCPLLQHNQAPRVAFETNQGKQTYGYYALNWPYRIDKNAYMQYCNEVPILRTLTAKYTSPNGCNLIVAVVVSDGNTQEDSGQVNKTATDNGLFAGCHFNFVKTELEKGEEFTAPDFTKTTNIKTFANYSKLDGSLVRAGTVLYENDVIVCKRQIIAKPTDKFIYSDKSIIYKYREPAVVEYAFISKDADDVEFAIIKFKSHRDFGIGNKFSSRAGMKGMLGITYVDYKMPFTESGIIPDLLINPSGFPTRLTVNQIIESHLAKLAGDKGVCTEGTAFTNTDFKATAAELEKRGFEPWGYERLYNGINGEWMDALVYTGVVYYQRLQKDVQDELYAVSTAQTCIMTRQPVEGKNKGGGLRMGEMERDCTASNGMMRMYIDKCREESDGYDINVCQNCSKLAAVNNKHGIFKCKNCGDNAVIYTVRSAYASKLFVQELESTNVGVKLKLAPFEFEEHQ
nr:DNA-directed RNA polymerase subunit beta [Kaumoebavirus]